MIDTPFYVGQKVEFAMFILGEDNEGPTPHQMLMQGTIRAINHYDQIAQVYYVDPFTRHGVYQEFQFSRLAPSSILGNI